MQLLPWVEWVPRINVLYVLCHTLGLPFGQELQESFQFIAGLVLGGVHGREDCGIGRAAESSGN